MNINKIKNYLVLLLFIFPLTVLGQPNLSKKQRDIPPKQIYLSNPDYYVYNHSKDTLHLTKIDVRNNDKPFWDEPNMKSSKVFDTIQIDGMGSKEVVFERMFNGSYKNIMQAHQEQEFTKIHKYEIWNIDTKTLLFEAIDDYEFSFENWQIHGLLLFGSQYDENGWHKGSCSYKYSFSIDYMGQINIIGTIYNNKNDDCIADNKEGFYKFLKGKYTCEY